jgi:hypothetical protein
MYYAGTSIEIALWETILRDVVADRDKTVMIPDAKLGNVLSTVTTKRSLRILDLSMPKLRLHAGGKAELETWLELTATSDYTRTHGPAADLLADNPDIRGLRWTSKQSGKRYASVFYGHPRTCSRPSPARH